LNNKEQPVQEQPATVQRISCMPNMSVSAHLWYKIQFYYFVHVRGRSIRSLNSYSVIYVQKHS